MSLDLSTAGPNTPEPGAVGGGSVPDRTPRSATERRWLALERVCWVSGCLLLAVWFVGRADGSAGHRAALERFEAARQGAAEVSAGAAAEPLATSPIDFALWSPKRIAAYRSSLGLSLETPLAILEIPRLGLRVAVLDGTDEVRLNRGVGRIPGTARPGGAGNLGIAGHRDGFFRVLQGVAPGDEVRLTTLDASVRYAVESIRIVAPSAVDVLVDTGAPALTLVTCYPFYFVGDAPQRYIVRAVAADQATESSSGANRVSEKAPS